MRPTLEKSSRGASSYHLHPVITPSRFASSGRTSRPGRQSPREPVVVFTSIFSNRAPIVVPPSEESARVRHVALGPRAEAFAIESITARERPSRLWRAR